MNKTEFKILNTKELQDDLKKMESQIPNEVRKMILEVAMVDIESYIKTRDIPIDTGRLRSSIHTKYIKNPQHNYSDTQGNNYDGTLDIKIDINSVAVGTNVQYADIINLEGGGGPNSARKSQGSKKPKGYGKGFFDKAILNGKQSLDTELRKLSKRIKKL